MNPYYLRRSLRLANLLVPLTLVACTTGPDPRGDFATCADARAAVAQRAPAFRGVSIEAQCVGPRYHTTTEYIKLTNGRWCAVGYSCWRQPSDGAGS